MLHKKKKKVRRMKGKHTVPVLTGYGDGEILLSVDYCCPRPQLDGVCAFCLGDPLNEFPDRDGASLHIKAFYGRHPKAETCPICDGRAS